MGDDPLSEDLFSEALADDDHQGLYEDAPCGYISMAGDGTILKVNRTFTRWTGYQPDALVGRRRFQDLLVAGDRIYYETHVGPLLRMQGSVREIAVDIVCESGDRLPILVWSSTKRDDPGRPTVIRSALFDASERRAYEQELLREKSRAQMAEAKMAELARTLQETLLPPVLEHVPGLDIAGAYRPAGDGSVVGGDFYDLFQTSGDRWSIVLGDVCGKGVKAASMTALVRYTVRSESLRNSRPSSVLEHLHDAVRSFRPTDFCTAVLMSIDVSDGIPHILVSAGGHPLPWHLNTSGGLSTLGEPGPLLGMFSSPKRSDMAAVLNPGEAVIFYTDGVTEGSNGGELFGDDRLRKIIEDTKKLDAEDMAERIVSEVLEFQGGYPRDDIAVVVMKVEDPAAG